jgi:hypothetical protein
MGDITPLHFISYSNQQLDDYVHHWQALPLRRCCTFPPAHQGTCRCPVHYSSAMAMTRGSVERNDTEQHVMSIVNIADFVTKPVGHPRIDVPQLTHGRELRIDERHITAAAAGFLATIGRDCGLTLLFGKRLGCWP